MSLLTFSKNITMLLTKNLKFLPKIGYLYPRPYGTYKDFRALLEESENIVVITGAGISQESGVPTLQSKNIWSKYTEIEMATPKSFATQPAAVWKYYNDRRKRIDEAKPNDAHITLAVYEKMCEHDRRNFFIITLNEDELHQRAGSTNVLELHGSLYKVLCTQCKKIRVNYDIPICEAFRLDKDRKSIDVSRIQLKELPHCSICKNGLLRPYVVWFGEQIEMELLQKSKELIEKCDLCIAIGTSFFVYPAALFALSVAAEGKPVVEFNTNKKPFDAKFTLIRGLCSVTIPRAFGVKLF